MDRDPVHMAHMRRTLLVCERSAQIVSRCPSHTVERTFLTSAEEGVHREVVPSRRWLNNVDGTTHLPAQAAVRRGPPEVRTVISHHLHEF